MRRTDKSAARRLVWLAYALALGTLLAMTAYWVEEHLATSALRRDTLDNARSHARELANVVARQTEATFKAFDLTLMQLRTAYRHDNPAQFEEAVDVALDGFSDAGIQGVVVTDAEGYVRYSSIAPAQRGVFLGDRDYIAAQIASRSDNLAIGTAVRSRLLQSWSIPVSRPIRKPDGSLQGIIVLGLNPSYFVDRMIDPRLSRHDAVALFQPDGSYLARNQRLDEVMGTKVPSTRPFVGAGSETSGEVRIRAPIDGRTRLYAWQYVPGYPVIANVGLDEETLLAPIEEDARRSTRQSLAISAVLLVLGTSVCLLLMRIARQQQALHESEARYRSAFEEQASIKLLLDPTDGHIVDANAAALSFYGYPRDALLGMQFHTLCELPPEGMGDFLRQAQQTRQHPFTLRQKLADGKMRNVEVYCGPIEVRGQALLFAVMHDVTERQALDEKLRLAALVFAHTHEGIFYCDTHGRIIDINRAFCELSGYNRAELLGRDLRFTDAGRPGMPTFTEIWRAGLDVGYWRGEVWIRRKSGEVRVELLDLVFIDRAGNPDAACVGVLSDITLLKENQQRLEEIAHYDVLTGLPNRSLIQDRVQQALRSAERHPEIMALAWIDLDGFKPVNDTYGHRVGDEVLAEVAHRLSQHLRVADTVSRMGGDEFVILLRNLSSAQEAQTILDRVVASVAEPYVVDDRTLTGVSASAGFACYPDDAVDLPTLMARADDTMYVAKRAGGNCAHRFRPTA